MKRTETIKPDEPINTVIELLDILKMIPSPETAEVRVHVTFGSKIKELKITRIDLNKGLD